MVNGHCPILYKLLVQKRKNTLHILTNGDNKRTPNKSGKMFFNKAHINLCIAVLYILYVALKLITITIKAVRHYFPCTLINNNFP